MPDTIRHNYFAQIDTEKKAYWLGFISADGGVDGNSLALKLAARDKHHVAKLRDAIVPGRELQFRTYSARGTETHSASLYWSSRKMVADLARHGVTTDKAVTLTPWNGPAHLLRHYWRGLVDGNGWLCGVSDLELGFCGGLAIVRGMKDFATSAGLLMTLSPKKSIWSVKARGRSAKALAAILYDGARISLSRKRERAVAFARRAFPPLYGKPSKEELVSAYVACGSWEQAAIFLGVPSGSVNRYARSYGLDTTRPKKCGRQPILAA